MGSDSRRDSEELNILVHPPVTCFMWISEQTGINSLDSINWLVFITEKKCVYCAVRTGYSYIIQVRFSLSRRWVTGLPPRKLGFDPRLDYVRFVVDKVTLGRVSLQVIVFSPFSTIPPTLRTYLHLYVALTRKTKGEPWKHSKKQFPLGNPERCVAKYSTFICSEIQRFSQLCCWICQVLFIDYTYLNRSQWPRGLRRGSAAARLLGFWVRVPPGAWMFVCCDSCVLSGRGLCYGMTPQPEVPYRLWCSLTECDR